MFENNFCVTVDYVEAFKIIYDLTFLYPINTLFHIFYLLGKDDFDGKIATESIQRGFN